MNATCPAATELDGLIEGRLLAPQEWVLEQHLAECTACRDYLSARSCEPWSPALPDPSSVPSLFRRTKPDSAAAAERVRPAVLAEMARAAAAAAARDLGSTLFGDADPGAVSLPELPGYVIRERLGGGASGEVYRAWDRKLQRAVALKFPRFRADRTDSDRERFRREGQVLARLKHPGIVTVFEVGEPAGRPYIAMEFVAGQTLAQAMLGQPQPTCRASALCESLALAVQRAHEAGLIHRDLKPANILLERPSARAQRPLPPGGDPGDRSIEGMPRIIDFGLAKDLLCPDELTADRDILGTPGYMAPEQARGRHSEVGPATDVYGLGAILYELLTGRPPYREESAYRTLLAVSLEPLVPPRKLRSGLPRDLETICLKCLEKEPRRRYPSAAALAEDLRRFREGFPIAARPTGPVGQVIRWIRRKPMAAGLIGLSSAVTLALSVGGPALAVREAHRRQTTERLAALARRQEQRAEAELARASVNFQLARQAVARMTDLLLAIPDNGEAGEHTTALQTRLELVAAEFHDRFAELQSRDPLIEIDRVESQVRLARLAHRQGNLASSQANLEAARATFQRLEREGQLPPERRFYWAVTLAERAHILKSQGQANEASESRHQALALMRDLTRQAPDRADWLAFELGLEATMSLAEPDMALASGQLRQIVERYQVFQDRYGISEPLATGQALAVEQLAASLKDQGRTDEAIVAYREALDRWRWLAINAPRQTTNVSSWIRLAIEFFRYLEQHGRALEALEVCDGIFDDSPHETRAVLQQAKIPVLNSLLFQRAELLMRQGQYARAEAVCFDALRYARGSQAMLFQANWLRAQALVRSGSPERAAAVAEDLLHSSYLPPTWIPRLAETLALASAAVAGRTPPEPIAADRYARSAVASLDRALSASERSRENVLGELKVLDLRALVDRDDYRELLRRHRVDAP